MLNNLFFSPTFSSIISEVLHNEIRCSICHKLILKHLSLCCSIEGDPIEREDLTSEQAVNLIIVLYHYIIIALNTHTEGDEERSQFCDKVMKAKI